MKLGIIFPALLVMGCTATKPPVIVPSAPAPVPLPNIIPVSVGKDSCHMSKNQPDDGDLVSLVCLSADKSVVLGVIIHRMYWSILTNYQVQDASPP